MTTTNIVGLCERLRRPHGGAYRLEAADTLERQADEINRLRLALVEAGMRIETCPGAYKSHVEIIVQKIRAAMTVEDTAGSPTSQNIEPGLAFSDAGEP
jgi:hypothetical protein